MCFDETGCNKGVKKCSNGTDINSMTVEVCAEEVSTCNSPIFVEYTGMSSQAYGYGVCGDAKDGTCQQCTAEDGADPSDTAVSAPADTKTCECYSYTYDAENFKAAKTATTCYALKSTLVRCNSPGERKLMLLIYKVTEDVVFVLLEPWLQKLAKSATRLVVTIPAAIMLLFLCPLLLPSLKFI